jgi:hypothetical protein
MTAVEKYTLPATATAKRYYIVLLKEVSSELASLLGHQHLNKQWGEF